MRELLCHLGSAGGRRYLSLVKAADRYLPELAEAPRTVKILVENLLRAGIGRDDHAPVAVARALIGYARSGGTPVELTFRPVRVLLQDHSGVPVLLDLTALRSRVEAAGGDPLRVRPVLPVDLVVDHSVEAFTVSGPDPVAVNMAREVTLNAERYRFLRWAEQAFEGLRVVPPGRGIVHQVHLEHLAQVVTTDQSGYVVPDTVVGTDSHTPMVNAIGVLGWGVGGVEATAVLMGDAVSLLSPPVVGIRLTGRPGTAVMATDLALAMASFLRGIGVVGKLVEFTGPGLRHLSLPDRATLANMAPEYGCTAAYFPIDAHALAYLRRTGRSADHVRLVEAYARAQGLFDDGVEPSFGQVLEFDLGAVDTTVAGPRRPHDRLALQDVPDSFEASARGGSEAGARPAVRTPPGRPVQVRDGAVAIAAITSCTNTANPEAMFAAGVVARRAGMRGLVVPEWVKPSLSPGSRAVTRNLAAAGLLHHLARLGFGITGYGCMTCIGNSGPLMPAMAAAIDGGVRAAAVLSGNRNFEGRIHPDISAAYLASPPLVVGYALAGTVLIDLSSEPLGTDRSGKQVYLSDLWPDQAELDELAEVAGTEVFQAERADLYTGDERWRALRSPAHPHYDWPARSTYIRRPPIAPGEANPGPVDILGARVLVWAGDSTTTDHISPAGAIPIRSTAGQYLQQSGVLPADFNSYGSRRGNHEVMVRGTFANPRFRNLLLPGRPGGWTIVLPQRRELTVHEAADHYLRDAVPVIVLAGRDYGMGSSRDWAAKGQALLGVRAVLATSFERIHRSNLVGMGIVPLEFVDADPNTLGLDGRESFDIRGLSGAPPRGIVTVRAVTDDGRRSIGWRMRVRIDTQRELDCVRAGGRLPAALRSYLPAERAADE